MEFHCQSICKKLIVACLPFFVCSAFGQQVWLTPASEQVIESIESQVIEWRRDIHANPELSNREYRTARLVADHLQSLGIDVTTEIAHTGVVGVLQGGKPGPTIALRADMDALPVTERVKLDFASTVVGEYKGQEVGVMHACGHDTHVAILMGVAQVLAAMQEDIPGTIKFIFQPAEEGAPPGEEGGARLMVEQGILENPKVEAAFALHIDSFLEAGQVSYNPGGTYASYDDLGITVTGKSAHGAYPWKGVDPIVASAHIVTALQTVVSRNHPLIETAAVVTIGSIHGGVRSNIIPEKVEMVGTIRALDPDARIEIHERIRSIATSVGEGLGAQVEVKIPLTDSAPVTFNDFALTSEMVPVLESVAGKENVILKNPETGAEDFSYISEKVPSFYFNLGGRDPATSVEETADHHTPDFRIDESGLMLGVRAMSAVALSYLSSRSTE